MPALNSLAPSNLGTCFELEKKFPSNCIRACMSRRMYTIMYNIKRWYAAMRDIGNYTVSKKHTFRPSFTQNIVFLYTAPFTFNFLCTPLTMFFFDSFTFMSLSLSTVLVLFKNSFIFSYYFTVSLMPCHTYC